MLNTKSDEPQGITISSNDTSTSEMNAEKVEESATQNESKQMEVPFENKHSLVEKKQTNETFIAKAEAYNEKAINAETIVHAEDSIETNSIHEKINYNKTVEEFAIQQDSIDEIKSVAEVEKEYIEIKKGTENTAASDEIPGLFELAINTIKKKVLKKEAEEEVDAQSVLNAVAQKIENSSKGDVALYYKEKENGSTYGITVGKFEFSRSKSR